ncbi:hypothetical protein MCJ35_13540 [Enterocloster sp. OA13]|uniref:hypothetical protein n=1 Tax=Enterocloster sp. OA13 TaxID=2914161 RepID=UPI001F068314|nr:hypothetical protein [Enterocloster sp. OA13]
MWNIGRNVTSPINQKELVKLRETWTSQSKSRAVSLRHAGKTVLLVDDSKELLHINKRVLRPEGLPGSRHGPSCS